MLYEKVIARVDFYPSGYFVPVGITNDKGISQFIDKVTKVEKSITKDEIKFYCISKDSSLVLLYSMGMWYKVKT